MIGFASCRSASAASQALASTVAELWLRPIFRVGEETRRVGQLSSCFGQANPTVNDAFRKRTQLPQTKPIGKS
jgi:hypothetical protein